MADAERSPAFGELLRRYRLEAGLSQEALAECTGLSPRTIQSLEVGGTRPYPDTIRRLTEGLSLPPEARSPFAVAARERGGAGPGLKGASSAYPAGAGPPADEHPPSNLPAPRTVLVGRAGEVARVREALARGETRLLTVTGLGGSGKTSVALQAARELRQGFPGGAWLVELAALGDPALVPEAVAVVLGVRGTPKTTPLEAVVASLRSRTVLLVLDNCEHLLDACADLAGRLLDACPRLRLLATSREPLLLSGERQLRLPPLAAPDPDACSTVAELTRFPAVRLFVERARAVEAGFALTAENAPLVAQVCDRLCGIPLALELAAARVPVLALPQLVARLDDALRLLTGGRRAGPTRQQTLRATLDWSHALLSAPERVVFQRLAVFAGGCDLDAAEAVCAGAAGPAAVLDLLGRLVDKSLLVAEAAGPAARYRLLEPVRQYAAAGLAAGDAAAARRGHAAHYLALAERAAPALRGAAQVAWLARLDREQDNLRAALSWASQRGDLPGLLRLGLALLPYWEVRGYLSEGRRWLAAALEPGEAEALPDGLRVRARIGAGRLAFWQADLAAAAAHLEAGAALARATGDDRHLAEALVWLGAAQGAGQAFGAARQTLEQGYRLSDATGEPWGAAWALLSLGRVTGNDAGRTDRWTAAAPLLEESRNRFLALGDVRCASIAGVYLGAILARLGAPGRSAALLQEGLGGLQAVGDRAYLFPGLLTLAWVAALTGAPLRAARLLGAAEGAAAALGATLAPVNRETQAVVLDAIREHLDEPALEAARSAGRALTVAQAVAEAGAPPAAPRADAVAGPTRSPSPPAPAAGDPFAAGGLTARERQVVQLLVRGESDRGIGAALGISASTAKAHVRNVLAKLALRSRWQVRDRFGGPNGSPPRELPP